MEETSPKPLASAMSLMPRWTWRASVKVSRIACSGFSSKYSENTVFSDAVLFTPDEGNLAGNTFLVVDATGVASYQAGTECVISSNPQRTSEASILETLP